MAYRFLAVSSFLLSAAACGASATPARSPVDRSPARDVAAPAPPMTELQKIHSPGPVDLPSSPAVAASAAPAPGVRQRIELLRELARSSDGTERLDLEHRLYGDLMSTGEDADQVEARALVEAIVASPAFGGWTEADAALYDLGTSRQAARRYVDASVAFRRLIAEHPASPYVADAELALADAAFADGDLVRAEAGYLRVIANPGPRSGGYARYKLGWVHLNLGRLDHAMADFLEVARTNRDPLRREALKDLVRVYEQQGVAAKALAFFEGVDPGQGGAMVLRLAELYADVGKVDDAVVAYRAALEVLDPAAGCDAAVGLVRVQFVSGRSDDVVTAIEDLADRHPTGRCGAEAEAVVTEVANRWTAATQLAREPALVAGAIRAWELVALIAPSAAARQAALAAAAELRALLP